MHCLDIDRWLCGRSLAVVNCGGLLGTDPGIILCRENILVGLGASRNELWLRCA